MYRLSKWYLQGLSTRGRSRTAWGRERAPCPNRERGDMICRWCWKRNILNLAYAAGVENDINVTWNSMRLGLMVNIKKKINVFLVSYISVLLLRASEGFHSKNKQQTLYSLYIVLSLYIATICRIFNLPWRKKQLTIPVEADINQAMF